MKKLGDPNTHYWLAQRMAKTTETDLVSAVEQAGLSQAEWALMIETCRGCDWAKGCQKWLAGTSSAVAAAPSQCVNQEKFSALKTALEQVDV